MRAQNGARNGELPTDDNEGDAATGDDDEAFTRRSVDAVSQDLTSGISSRSRLQELDFSEHQRPRKKDLSCYLADTISSPSML